MGKRGRKPKKKMPEETKEKLRKAYKMRVELKEKEAQEELKNQQFDSNKDIREQLADFVGLNG
jgi:hypothetical protein